MLVGLGVFVAVVVVGAIFVRAPKPNPIPSASSTQSNSSPSPSGETEGQINEIKVSVKEFAYSPSKITVKKGERVRIILTNDGAISHDLSIRGIGVSTKTIVPGESDSIEFTPGAAGSFVFVCTVDSHEDLGLTGTLEVK